MTLSSESLGMAVYYAKLVCHFTEAGVPCWQRPQPSARIPACIAEASTLPLRVLLLWLANDPPRAAHRSLCGPPGYSCCDTIIHLPTAHTNTYGVAPVTRRTLRQSALWVPCQNQQADFDLWSLLGHRDK